MTGTDEAFDAFLADALAPPDRPPDPVFVARVDRAVLASMVYRRQRKALWRQFGGEMLAIAAVGASLAMLARIPDLRELLAQTSGFTLPALVALPMLMLWILVTKARPVGA